MSDRGNVRSKGFRRSRCSQLFGNVGSDTGMGADAAIHPLEHGVQARVRHIDKRSRKQVLVVVNFVEKRTVGVESCVTK